MLIFFALILSFSAVVMLYLTSPHQHWLPQPLRAIPWRWIAILGIVASSIFWMAILDSKAGFFSALVAMMLWSGLVPFAHLLRRSADGRDE